MNNAIKKLSWYRPLSEIFEHLHENENVAFLDSSLVDQRGHYSIIGLNVVTIFSSEKGLAYQDGHALSTSFEVAVKSFFAQHKRRNNSVLPLTGGGIGYFTYDFGLKYLDFESRHETRASIPEAHIVIYDNFLIEDCHEKTLFITASGFLKEENRALEETESWLKSLPDTTVAALREELRLSHKERSELLMIVDLLRNDLNRVCETGSVKVRSHYDIEEYATVFHLVTAIEGRLSHAHDALDLVRASFPGGSITGAPKRRAVEIIDELESTGRGLYTGSIGYIGLDGACDLNIVIRTAFYQAGIYQVGVGGGITYESDPAFEYQETLQKARALLEALYDGKN